MKASFGKRKSKIEFLITSFLSHTQKKKDYMINLKDGCISVTHGQTQNHHPLKTKAIWYKGQGNTLPFSHMIMKLQFQR